MADPYNEIAALKKRYEEKVVVQMEKHGLVKCAACETIYNPEDYGRSKVYCSAQCRHTIGGTQPVTTGNPQGRPRRFPKPTEDMKARVIEFFMKKGWLIGDIPLSDDEYKLMAIRGHYTVRISVGGRAQREAWAHCIAYTAGGEIVVESACVKIKNKHGYPNPHFNDTNPQLGKYMRRGPCYQADGTCKKCLFKQILINSGKA